MEAIAITDHGNVQGFTDAYHAVQKMKNPPKSIYGVEGYLVDDLKEVVVNPKEVSLDDGFVVFDIETTGFSPTQNRIIEYGFVTSYDLPELINQNNWNELRESIDNLKIWLIYNKGKSVAYAWDNTKISDQEARKKAELQLLLMQ